MSKNRQLVKNILINGEKIEYKLTRRKGMRSIRLRLDESGVVLASAPYQVAESFIEETIKEHWADLSAGRSRQGEARKRWEKFVASRLEAVPDWTVKHYGDDIVAGRPYEAGSIFNGMPLVSSRIEFQNLFWNAYEIFSRDHQIKINDISMRKMKSRWGSCRPGTGKLTFNLLLLYVPKECARYVIFHELCHYLELNHSKRFWAHVAEYVPSYKEIEKKLNEYGKILIDRVK